MSNLPESNDSYYDLTRSPEFKRKREEALNKLHAKKGFAALQTVYKYFYEELYPDSLDDEQLDAQLSLLENSDLIPEKLEGVVQALQSRRIVPNQSPNQSLRQAIAAIEETDRQYKTELELNRGITLVYGSVIYGDPYNLDYDIMIASVYENPQLNLLIDKYARSLDSKWPVSPPHGNISYWSLERFLNHHNHLLNDDVDYFKNNSVLLAEINLSSASIPLTALATSNFDSRDFWHIRDRIWAVAEANPFIGALMTDQLQQALDIRLERRGSNNI